MLARIIHFAIHHKLVIGLLTIALIIWGLFSLSRLPIDAVPDITNNQVQVITTSPALAAPEVERLITFPIETAMATLPGLSEIRSISRFGLSVITLVFPDAADSHQARQQIAERLGAIRTVIPPELGIPELAPMSTGLGEIYQYILHPREGFESEFSPTELRSLQDWLVRRQLLGLPGVADVSSFGGFVKQYEVAVAPDKLRSLNISLEEVFKALESNNQNTGGAYIDKRPNTWFIRSEGLINSLEDLKKIPVKTVSGKAPILIRDVGEVGYGHAVRYGALTYNDQGEAVGGIVMMLKGANSSQVIDRVKERMEQIRKTLPPGVEIEAFLDRSTLVNQTIRTVSTNLIEGALIVIFVLVLLLGNWRAGLIVASVIPLSMLFAISMMHLFGVSGNLMSLGAIDFGLIVDGSVIIVEATLHHLHLAGRGRSFSREEINHEVFEASSKIRKSAAFGEIIILIVYLPLLTLSGIEGKMFKPMAQTVSFAILGAFILSLTYVPMMSALLLRQTRQSASGLSDRLMAYLQSICTRALQTSLRHSGKILAVVVLFVGLCLFLFARLGGEFIPQLDEGDFAVETRVLAGSSLAETVQASRDAAATLLRHFPDETKEVIGKIGSAEIPTDPMPIEASDLMVILHPKGQWTQARSREELAGKMQEKLQEEVPGVAFGFQQPIQMRFNELMTGIRQDVGIKIYGEDLTILTDQARKISQIAATVPGAADIYTETILGLPQIVVQYNRDLLAQHAVSIETANRILQTAFAGGVAGYVYEGEKRFELVLRLAPDFRQDIASVQNLQVPNAHGEPVPLQQIADIALKPGINQIQRDDAKRRAVVAFNVRGRDVERTVHELREKIESGITLPTGYYITYGGQFQNLEEARERLAWAVPIALGLILALLYFTFHSLRQSLLIFTAVPLAATGGILALVLRDMPFSISAGVGFIALSGVAVLNGIVLLAEFNSLRQQGITDLRTVVIRGTQTRLRPVLMTALVASLGFLPMALSQSAGAEVQRPLATVVIGGILTATLLTLLILPILYIRMETYRLKRKPLLPFLLVLVGYLTVSGANAQPVPLALEEAIHYAKTHNLNLSVLQQQTNRAALLQQTSREISPLTVSLGAGQYDSYRVDHQLVIGQAFPNPAVFKQQAGLLEARTQVQEALQTVGANQLIRMVKQSFYDWYYLEALQELQKEQIGHLEAFAQAAETRLKAGDAPALGVITARSRLSELQSLAAGTRNDQKNLSLELQGLLQYDTPVIPARGEPARREIQRDTTTPAFTPLLVYRDRLLTEQKAATALRKSERLPGFSLTYGNHTLIGSEQRNGRIMGAYNRFHTVEAGLSIPVFSRAYRSRIAAGKLSEKIAETELKAEQVQLYSEWAQARNRLQTSRENLANYEATTLAMGGTLLEQADKAYRLGEIGYVEYMQAVEQQFQIKSNYLRLLNLYNQAVITLEFLAGGR